ncbi:hypothetical protein GQR58_016157 [Nymphon striatum]|nr:hypothetical protein GQR58_016157 [Nymphon striatum]
MKGQCVYNAKWESDPQYKEWIGALKGDKKKALCKLCDRLILLSSMGESALKSHAKSEKHKNIIQSKQGITLSDFGFGSSATASTSGEVKKVTAMFTSETDLIVSPPLEDAAAAPKVPGSVKSFLIKDDVLRAEILWTLKAVTSHMSFSSSKNMSELLPKMFPDSEIAKQFQCGERKMAYVCVYGLAEFFKKLLNESIKGQFVVLFDESLNKKMQEKQMDVHVRYIDEANEVKTRYFGSTFLGHGTANDLMDHFTKSVLESGLPVKNMIQVSMDGPNVNWKFYGNLKKKLNDEYGTSLINIGSCGLHIVHNSFKRGMDATGWKVASFLSSLYYLFKDAPARKEDYVNVTSATLMPLKFVKHRWLENVPVCQRALDTWDSIVKFVKATQSGQLNKPNNKSYEIVKECVNDKCFLAKLHFFKCIASLLQPFLKKYQTDKPMMPFISDDLCMIIRTLMRRFIKNEYLECSNEKLIKIDVSDKNLQVNYKKIDIGYASEKLKNVKPSEREILEFRMECKACLVDLLKKLLEKCPATYSLVRHLSCLNPVNMASDKEVCSAKFKKVLMLLLSSGRISEKDCDPLLQEYGLFLDNIPVFGTIKFSNFDNSTNRLDSLFFEYMSGPNYIQLLSVVKLILVMSHGQASVERGFSINKEIEVENMKEHTLVARRMVCDHVNTVKGVTSVDINKSLLLSVKHSRKKYEQYLEQQRVNKKSDDLRAKRKSTLEEIEEIKKKKRRLDADIKCLNETADQLLQKAEDEGKLSHLTKANSFRRTAKDKMQQLVQTDISLKDQLQKLKRKTTLASKIAYDWAYSFKEKKDSNKYIQDFSLVLVIPLRTFEGVDFEDKLFRNIFPSSFSETKKRKSLMKCLEKNKENILLILDGFDEVKSNDAKEHIHYFLDRKFLSFCSFIVTSQPKCTKEIHSYFNVKLKIFGFLFPDVENFVEMFFSRSKNYEGKMSLLKVLTVSEKPIYSHLSACPLFLLLLCCMAEEKGEDLPSQSTEVMKELTNCSMRRCLMKQGINIQCPFVDKNCNETLLYLGLLSFSGLLKGQGHLSELEMLLKAEDECGNELLETGLFHQVTTANVIHDQCNNTILQPIHQIFMEFLASYYLYSKFQSTDEIVSKLILMYHTPNDMTYTLIFLGGLLKEDAHELYKLLPSDTFRFDPLAVFRLLHESGYTRENVLYIQKFLHLKPAYIEGKDCILKGWLHLLKHPDCKIDTFTIEWSPEECVAELWKNISNVISQNINLISLNLKLKHGLKLNEYETENFLQNVGKIFESISFQEVYIVIREIRPYDPNRFSDFIKTLCSYFSSSKSLQIVSINMDLNANQLMDITSAIMKSKSITEISFPFLRCSKETLAHISKLLYLKSKSLRYFAIENFCRDSGASAHNGDTTSIEHSEYQNCVRRCLHLPNTFRDIFQALQSKTCHLETLDLSYCTSNCINYECLGKALCTNATLKSLILCNANSFSEVKPVILALEYNKCLQKLDISSNNIMVSDDNVEEIAKLKQPNRHLFSLIANNWTFEMLKLNTLDHLLKILNSFEGLSFLDISNSSCHVHFETDTTLYTLCRSLPPNHDRKSRLSMNNLKVFHNNRILTAVDCISIALRFPIQTLDAAVDVKSDPVSDSAFVGVFKVISKLPSLDHFNMINWKVKLKSPDDAFDKIAQYLSKHDLRSINFCNLQIKNEAGECLLPQFIYCILKSMEYLSSMTFSVSNLSVTEATTIAKSIEQLYYGELLTLNLRKDLSSHSLHDAKNMSSHLLFEHNSNSFTCELAKNLILALNDTDLVVENDYVNQCLKVRQSKLLSIKALVNDLKLKRNYLWNSWVIRRFRNVS